MLRRLIECLSRDRTKHPGRRGHLTRPRADDAKEAWPRLLETFSEACEGVCRSWRDRVPRPGREAPLQQTATGGGNSNGNGQSGRRQRGNGGNNNGNGNGQSQERSLRRRPSPTASQRAPSRLSRRSRPRPSLQRPRGRRRKPRRSTSRRRRLQLPERPKKARKKRGGDRKGPKTPAEQLLDSVLDALPEPKAPGQGRGRRRVSTAALTGTPVSVNNEPSAPVAAADSES